ncbi:MAG: hypothetical protein SP4CHLAM5_12120 [Chlamydiia bacterium]|nr:hypothetical protein [Chlamydiia bacterium]
MDESLATYNHQQAADAQTRPLPEEVALFFKRKIEENPTDSPFNTLCTLFEGGLPANEAMLLAAHTLGNVADDVMNTQRDLLVEGYSPEKAEITAKKILPQITVYMQGKLPETLKMALQSKLDDTSDHMTALVTQIKKGLPVFILRQIIHFEKKQLNGFSTDKEVDTFYQIRLNDDHKARAAAARLLPLIFPESQTI